MKPATELPWQKNGLVVHGGPLHEQVGKADSFLGSLDAMQNAAYIVHAANAYPLCVSEVKQLLKMVGLIPAKSAAQVATIEAVIERGETLLRELGEEE